MRLRFRKRTISPGWHIGVFVQRPILVIDIVKLRLEVAYVESETGAGVS